MKQLTTLFLLGLCLVSCNSDDTEFLKINEENVASDWVVADINASEALDIDGDGESSTNLFEQIPMTCTSDDILRLTLSNQNRYYKIENDDVCDDNTSETIKYENIWTLEDNVLILYESNFGERYDIVELNENYMTLIQLVSINEDGTSLNYFYRYKRL